MGCAVKGTSSRKGNIYFLMLGLHCGCISAGKLDRIRLLNQFFMQMQCVSYNCTTLATVDDNSLCLYYDYTETKRCGMCFLAGCSFAKGLSEKREIIQKYLFGTPVFLDT